MFSTISLPLNLKNSEDIIEVEHTSLPKDFVLFKDNNYYFTPKLKSDLGIFNIEGTASSKWGSTPINFLVEVVSSLPALS